MKIIRKKTQLSMINPKGAGRPALHDIGIRHTARPKITRFTALHLTIKVRSNKADIKSKKILKALHHAIKRARLKKLKVVHYTLEFNHLHLLIECESHQILHQGMQALGISLAKAINKIKLLKGSVYKHRYHFRRLATRRELKNALHYIFNNGKKHKRTRSILDPYNSLVAEKRIPADVEKIILRSPFLSELRRELQTVLDVGKFYGMGVSTLWE
ncbi:MAG: transposase [Bacteriovorax sp.]|nr:transposase [Bacteriovorax sp.]